MSIKFLKTVEERLAVDSPVRPSVDDFPTGWKPHPLPPYPEGFTKETFVLPEHQTRLSSVLNPHPLDDRIRFDEAPHIYYIDGVAASVSVTGLVHPFCNEFDADKAIQMMRKSKNWPRPIYTHTYQLQWKIIGGQAALQLAEMRRSGDTVPVNVESEVDSLNESSEDLETCTDALKSIVASKFFGSEQNQEWINRIAFTDDEIKEAWRCNTEDACNKGTWFHLQCELWLNRDDCYLDWDEMGLFLIYVERLETLGIKIFRSEWEVFAIDYDVAGSVDFVGIYTEGPNKNKLMLADWKRAKDLRNKRQDKFNGTMAAPLQKLPDSSLGHYAIQLNLYKYLIEQNYGYSIGSLEVVCCHVDNGDQPFVYECPDLQPVARFLLCQQRVSQLDKICLRKKLIQQDAIDEFVRFAVEELNEAKSDLENFEFPEI